MPSTPLTCCSIGSATASTTVRALAPGLARGDLHGRRHDIRILRDRQREQRDGADHYHQDGEHVRENGPLDEKIRDHARRYLPPAAGDRAEATVCSCGSTFWPGMARRIPATTTRSSGLSPLSITRSSPILGPIVTLRCSTRSSLPTTSR